MKALVVDDEVTHRLLLQTFLSKYGDCQVAENGKEAVDAFRTATEDGQAFDLICMDVLMPGMDGHQSCKRIRAFERTQGVSPSAQAKIIMATALNDQENVTQSAQDQCDAYLLKPIDTGRLLYYLKSFGLVP